MELKGSSASAQRYVVKYHILKTTLLNLRPERYCARRFVPQKAHNLIRRPRTADGRGQMGEGKGTVR